MTGRGPLAVGVDIGTQGVRAVAVDSTGTVVARAAVDHLIQVPFPGWVEQDPRAWWNGLVACVRQLGSVIDLRRVRSVATAATSGTLCLLDADGQPVRPAIVYSDARATREAQVLTGRSRTGRIHPTDALAKAEWVRSHEPEAWGQVRALRPPNDFIARGLTGRLPPFDQTQAAKFGWDPIGMRWDGGIYEAVGLPVPDPTSVVEPGTDIGPISADAASELGLPLGTRIAAGATDGVCGFLACRPVMNQGCTILGTTLVWKTMSQRPATDERAGIYSHRGVGGTWFPGAASNSGGGILNELFPHTTLAYLDTIMPSLPTDGLVYPLSGRGERFPFRNPAAASFRILPAHADERQLYAACLEGVAFVERWGYERLAAAELLDGLRGITSAGGGSNSLPWLGIRASILGRSISVPDEAGSAFGAALLASESLGYPDPLAAAEALVRRSRTVDPLPDLIVPYDEVYRRFREETTARGWV